MTRAIVSIPYGLGFRNLVCCGILQRLADQGCELTVLLPPLAEPDLAVARAELPPASEVRSLPVALHSHGQRLLKFLKQHYYGERTGLESFAIKKRFRRHDTPVFHAAATALERAASLVVDEAAIDRWLLSASYPFETYYRDLIAERRPDVVVVTKPGYHPDELPLLKMARAAAVPTISIDTTWDNMVSKRPPYVLPDAATVWNPEMAGEAARYYQMRPESIVVTGGVQFDAFFTPGQPVADAREALGLDRDRPLIVFAMSNPTITSGMPSFVAGLVERVTTGKVRGEPSLVLRTHPWDPFAGTYQIPAGAAHVRLERPFLGVHEGSKFECLPTHDAVDRQAALYRAADVLVNIASTTSLDGIAADVPVVNIAFDAVETHPELSVARFSSYTHYRPIAESGAVRLARSWDQLCVEIDDCLADRARDAQARAAARERFLGPVDGRSFERVADAVIASAARGA
jgi:hypothetical protein